MKSIILGVLLVATIINVCVAQQSKSFRIIAGQPIKVACDVSEEKVVKTALELLDGDCRKVFSSSVVTNSKIGDIIVGTIGQSQLIAGCGIDLSPLKKKKQAFILAVSPKGKLVVAGSDKLGTAYGVLEISRIIGVSPWEWWADVKPAKKEYFSLSPDYRTMQSPSVEYRGIFINDEDWGILPWSSQTYEPEAKLIAGIDPGKTKKMKTIGPKTYSKVFELLLRLRANTIWPAMHEVTIPFYFVEGNREAADKYGIYIGSSHCEPLARCSATEWKIAGNGDYNYLNNKDNVVSYWTDRLKVLKNSSNIFTMGMRGKHDGRMEGVKNTEEYKSALTQVLADQKDLLKKYISPNPSKVPQIFVPYKEVLDVYNAGLEVPDYITLVWPDDNFGYIRHFPNEMEKKRSGGNGVYYHVSYWGAPHDNLWLGMVSPGLLVQQMKLAYEKDARKMWILNVGDIKPSEYLTELFLDMAWDINSVKSISGHLNQWLSREFGENVAAQLLPVMQEHYRLAHIKRPEFLGNTRVYDNQKYSAVNNLPWSEDEINKRLMAYKSLSDVVEEVSGQISSDKQDAFFELIKYPVQASVQMNNKILYAQFARHGKADWKASRIAFDSIASLTQKYNNLNHGKWNRMMDFQPRRLSVFDQVKEEIDTVPMPNAIHPLYLWNGADCANGNPIKYEGLGFEGKAAGIGKNTALNYPFGNMGKDSVEVEIRLLPTHAVENGLLRFSVSIDNSTPLTFGYETKEYSEEWKQNVLCNQAVRRMKFLVSNKSSHQLTIKALDEGVIVDQILLY